MRTGPAGDSLPEMALERLIPDPRARAFAGHPDPQGIGGPSVAYHAITPSR